MFHSRFPLALAFAAVVLTAADSQGQSYRSTTAIRGSDGPSQQLGRIGGANTAFNLNPANARRNFLTEGSIGPVISSRLGPFTGLGAERRIAELPAMLLPSDVRLPNGYISNTSLLGGAYRNLESVRYASGFADATSMYTPIEGWYIPDYTILRTPPALPEQPNGAYEQFFGIVERVESGSPPGSLGSYSGADLLDQVNERSHAARRERALRAFRDGTTGDATSRYERLDDAAKLLATVRSLDQGDALVTMLAIHTQLERDMVPLAAELLFDLVRRRPDVFRERPDMASYFGDAKVYQAHINRFTLTDPGSSPDADQRVVRAYCAWLRGDTPRLAQELEAAATAAEGTPRAPQVQALATAIRGRSAFGP